MALRVRFARRHPETSEYQEIVEEPLYPMVELLLDEDGGEWPLLDIRVQPDGDIRISWQSIQGTDTLSVIPSSYDTVVLRPTTWRK